MAHHTTVFSQLLKLVPRHEFESLARRHHRGRKLRSMSRWSQFLALTMGQLTGRCSLRDIVSNLTLQTGGVFRSAASGLRVEITSTDDDRITFITADSFEAAGASLRAATTGVDGSTRVLVTRLGAPITTGDTNGVNIQLQSESEDETLPPRFLLGYGGGNTGIPQFQINDDFRIMISGLGTAALPALGVGTNGDDGIFSPGDGELAITIGGSEMWSTTATRADFESGGLSFIRFPVKTTTGDPSGIDGDVYVNLFDNKMRLRADGAWRDVVTW